MRIGGHDLVSSLMLGAACCLTFVLLADGVGPALSETSDSAEIGAMWAVVATIFVFRAHLTDGLGEARTRLAATALSLVVCLAYLLVLPVTAIGIGLVIGAGSLLALAVDRPQDAALTGITSTVVLVVADLGDPSRPWEQPLLRLLDTVIGIAVGLVAVAVSVRLAPRPIPLEGHRS
jgi:uncharacterized membrane protein YccC